MLPSEIDVVVIGAGAAGLMTAITAGQRGRKVLVLDHANKVGKKILMSGGGRCNFTNMYTEPVNYLSHNDHFCKSALARYTQWDFIDMVCRHGIAYHEKKLGQLFCDNKASDIVKMLVSECEQAGAKIQLKCDIEKISNSAPAFKEGFTLKTSLGDVQCQSLVIATGGLSIPTMGATGFGYQVAHQYGLNTLATSAGLVPLTMSDDNKKAFAELSGNSCQARVTVCVGEGKNPAQQDFLEDILFTHRGLSGPAILQISSYWQPGKTIELDILPTLNLQDFLAQMQRERPKLELKTIIGELLTKKIAQVLLTLFGFSESQQSRPINQFTPPELAKLAKSFHHWQVKPSGTEGYRTAEVTLGGVCTDELSSKTMAAKKRENLYFVGEVVDVTGHLGGFNFQWAWASGFAAGSFV